MINLNSYKNATIFHSLEFNKIIEEILCKKVNFVEGKNYFYINHPDKKLKLLKINYCPDPRLECVYGGILGDKTEALKKMKGFWHISTAPGEDIKEYLMKGFYAKERFTSILNLEKSEEELWNNLNKKTRNLVRKGEKSGIKILRTRNIGAYYDILKKTYGNAGLKILPKEFYSEMLKRLGELFLANYNGKIVAGAMILKFRDKIYYWSGCSYKEYNHLAANDLTQWKLIKWARKNSFKEYDLLGLDIPTIAKFKESFGGKKISFYTLYSKPLYKLRKLKNLIRF